MKNRVGGHEEQTELEIRVQLRWSLWRRMPLNGALNKAALVLIE